MTYTGRYGPIPTHMMDSLQRYIQNKLEPGGFLSAVIENDLTGAVERADDYNIHLLPVYIEYLYNYAPSSCWGYKGVIKNWITSTK